MDRLMELQSRLRELTEAKKAKWRELGSPLPEDVPPVATGPAHPEAGKNGAGTDTSEAAGAAPGDPSLSGSAAGQPPVEASAPVYASRRAAEASAPAAAPRAVAEESGASIDANPGPGEKRFARRRDKTAEWASEARKKVREARQFTGAFWRQAVGQVRDLTGGLGARHSKRKPRPGDPVTAEELIDDRSLGARLLGAAVFFVGLVAIGAVALVQLGRLEIPWLEDNALPAATATAGSGIEAANGTALTEQPPATPEADDVQGAGPEMESSEAASDADAGTATPNGAPGTLESALPSGDTGKAAEFGGNASEPSGSEAGLGEAMAREVREFTRLQGELAFLIGEYEIVKAAFERGEADCEELNTHYSNVDNAHLLMSRVVARWREVPYRQVKAYEEISGLVDGTLRHYAASGCGLDPSELPEGR